MDLKPGLLQDNLEQSTDVGVVFHDHCDSAFGQLIHLFSYV